ncbi:unnamed protein product [Staurois parvus]|uniref:Uncharacterized protein n=1 Tax=Staurois parvus TaxID=386267 RepID=A0ABN9ETZ6_9NEOB|nr:unnamed protein product [Staurois parvus]
MILHFQGGELYVNNTLLLPVSICTLLWMDVHSTAMQSSVMTVKHTQLTVNQHTAHS